MSGSRIEWTDCTWNPLRGCSKVSAGCANCYAERQAARFSGVWSTDFEGIRHRIDLDDIRGRKNPSPFRGVAEMTDSGPRWTGKVELVESKLTEPLRWRKPRRVFVNSMSDLFHEAVPDEWIDRVFETMAATPNHTYQVLTKRPARMLEYARRVAASLPHDPVNQAVFDLANVVAPPVNGEARSWPLPNVFLGVSVEDQRTADERIPLLLETPAAVRFVSAEPLLGPVDLYGGDPDPRLGGVEAGPGLSLEPFWMPGDDPNGPPRPAVDWVIVGGEIGPGARPCDLTWIRSIVEQCKAASVPCFVKQLGRRPIASALPLPVAQSADSIMMHGEYDPDPIEFSFRDRKGADPSEWPEDLRVREFPEDRS